MKTAQYWIDKLALEAHPEGGFYSRVYESDNVISTITGVRPSATAIHYLLEQQDFSSWHRIRHDEMWFFHTGLPITVHEISESGTLSSRILSQDHEISLTVKGGTWFCSEPTPMSTKAKPEQFGLVSCVVSPGFDFKDFEMGNVEELINLYPQHRDIICRMCRS